MSLLAATIRETKTKGEVKSLRSKGMVPGIIYGGEEPNQKISVSVKEVKNLLNKENILSNIISINIDGKEQKVLPRVIDFDTVTDEPIHLDFLRIVKGAKVILEIPVKFINHELSPGLKRGGVLNIVRRKVELRCPTENIPTELVVDLNNLEIGDEVITSGGIVCTLVKLTDSYVTARTGNNQEIVIQRQQINSVLPKGTVKSLFE